MRVLIDIVHPAHAHFYHYLISAIQEQGHSICIASRDKDVTQDLLNDWGLPHTPLSAAGGRSIWTQGMELLQRDWRLWQLAQSFKPDVVLTRNPCGTHIARLVGATGIFDTDDGRNAGLHFSLAAPTAHIITSPDALGEDLGPKHRQYCGYKALAYLHPNHYTPDPTVRRDLGVPDQRPYAIVRFVALAASHDHGESGFAHEQKRILIERLLQWGEVFVSCEGPYAKDLPGTPFRLPPSRIHDALACADLYVGDSQTMAAEAAILGTPVVRASSWTGRLRCAEDLENRYGLIRSFQPHEHEAIMTEVERLVQTRDAKEQNLARRDAMIAEKEDVTRWYLNLLQDVASGR